MTVNRLWSSTSILVLFKLTSQTRHLHRSQTTVPGCRCRILPLGPYLLGCGCLCVPAGRQESVGETPKLFLWKGEGETNVYREVWTGLSDGHDYITLVLHPIFSLPI